MIVMLELSLICVLLSFFIGYFGRNKKMGFWGYFFASLFLTPFIGILLVIVSDKNKANMQENTTEKRR